MAVTGLANLAVKVSDLDAACAFYATAGGEVRDRMEWQGGERADVYLGPVMITLFTRALYEDRVDLPAEGFLHPALFTDDLDAQLQGHDVVLGPRRRRGHLWQASHRLRDGTGRDQVGIHGAARTAEPGRGGPTMKVTRFHHVSVNANGTSLDEMVGFYGNLLGLDDADRPDIPGIPGHWHTVGDLQLHLVGAPSRGPGIDPTGHHFCVAVEDLDEAVSELEAKGIDYERAVQGPGTVQIWIIDPAGNTIELQQETASR